MSSLDDAEHLPRRVHGMLARSPLRRLAGSALMGCLVVTSACTAPAPEIIGDAYEAPRKPIRGPADVQPRVGWVDVGRRFYVTTWGSSACPLAPTALMVEGEGLTVTMTGTGGPDCTADVASNSYVIDVPEPLRGEGRLDVVLDLGRADSAELVLER